MPASIGQSAIYTSIIPNINWKLDRLSRIQRGKLSKEAKRRLSILDFYHTKANRNMSTTCRHFLVSRSFVYKWLARFNPRDLTSLEEKSRRPKHLRTATYCEELVATIRKIRQENPSFSAVKIAYILVRDYSEEMLHVSAATIGRIIKRFNLFFSRVIQLHKDHAASARRGWIKRRAKTKKPYGLKAIRPHQIVEFDMKHIWIRRPGANTQRHYAFCAVDPYTKEAMIHISSRPNANNARVAIERVLDYFGRDIVILNDNGSENMGRVYDYLREQEVTQLFARPHEPKDKPHVENFIGKFQKECLDEDDGIFKTVAERQAQADRWLNTYHFYRPHQALNYQTPQEFCDTLGLTIPHRNLSTM